MFLVPDKQKNNKQVDKIIESSMLSSMWTFIYFLILMHYSVTPLGAYVLYPTFRRSLLLPYQSHSPNYITFNSMKTNDNENEEVEQPSIIMPSDAEQENNYGELSEDLLAEAQEAAPGEWEIMKEVSRSD